jgi:hypothetical protein
MRSEPKTLEEVYEQMLQEGKHSITRYIGSAAAAASMALGSDDIPKPRPGKSMIIPPEYLVSDIPKPRPGKSTIIPISPLDSWLTELKKNNIKIKDIDLVIDVITGLPEVKKDLYNKTVSKDEDTAKKQIITDISSKISMQTRNQLLNTLK